MFNYQCLKIKIFSLKKKKKHPLHHTLAHRHPRLASVDRGERVCHLSHPNSMASFILLVAGYGWLWHHLDLFPIPPVIGQTLFCCAIWETQKNSKGDYLTISISWSTIVLHYVSLQGILCYWSGRFVNERIKVFSSISDLAFADICWIRYCTGYCTIFVWHNIAILCNWDLL